MMNHHDHFGFSGRNRNGFCGSDSAPYRRPYGRGLASNTGYALNSRMGQGCGCGGMNRQQLSDTQHTQACGHRSDEYTPLRDRVCNDAESGRSNGCGCNTGSDRRLMEQIRAVDFALYETILYLDVYPHSCDAMETYHKLKAQREALHREYETMNSPLTAFGNQSTTSWDWMSKPFPWEYDAD